MAEPGGVGPVLSGCTSPAHRCYFFCRSCGATRSEERLIEVGYPSVVMVDEKATIIITREVVCENCLAWHDASLDLAMMDPEEVPN